MSLSLHLRNPWVGGRFNYYLTNEKTSESLGKVPKSQLAKEERSVQIWFFFAGATSSTSLFSLFLEHEKLRTKTFLLQVQGREKRTLCTIHAVCQEELVGQLKDSTVGTFYRDVSAALLHLSSLHHQSHQPSKINPYLVQIKITLHIVAPLRTSLHSTHSLYFQAAGPLFQKDQYQGVGSNLAWFYSSYMNSEKSSLSLGRSWTETTPSQGNSVATGRSQIRSTTKGPVWFIL